MAQRAFPSLRTRTTSSTTTTWLKPSSARVGPLPPARPHAAILEKALSSTSDRVSLQRGALTRAGRVGRAQYLFEDVAYKPRCAVAMIDESPKLAVASRLVAEGKHVVIRDRYAIIAEVPPHPRT